MEETNFSSLIKMIMRRSRTHTLEYIASQVGVSVSAIHALKQNPGRDPRFKTGCALIDLERRTRSKQGSPDAWS